ncbi:gamma-glutamyltransferase family protein [Streptomyces sp. NPDC017979]|uniref:gamma-glutamyltransferase family protein n=1 Tax=Streptomyces sp. NPDC017979 TaxID=3365024 RepID=UPI00378A9B70
MAVLERGGNAFDAAVAAAFVLQVVEPQNNGPAGDVTILVHGASAETTRSICGQGPMPATATLHAFRDLGLSEVPGSGLLPATVPGAVGAWLRLLAEFGSMKLADVLDYAIGYAAGGFSLLPETTRAIAALAPLYTADWTGSAATYLPGGLAPTTRTRFTNPALAETYRRLILAGAGAASREAQIQAAHDAFYQGFVAEAIDRFARTASVLDSTGRRHGAFLRGDDLATWEPTVEDATHLDYRGQRVCKPGIWSQGPVFLQQLALLDGFDFASVDASSAEYVHTVVECAKLAMADREAWYGDPLHSELPLEGLLDPGYTDERRKLIGQEASTEPRPGSPNGQTSWIPLPQPVEQPPVEEDWMAQIRHGVPNLARTTAARDDTCCVTVADREGNLVAATPSGGWLKSSPAIAELGFPLGTRGQSMWLVEGHPNSLAPRRRPRTTLSPTIVLREGRPGLAFGTPGGDRQDQWTLLFFLAVTHFQRDLQQATELPMFHTDALPASFAPREYRPRGVTVERSFSPEVVSDLRQRGHDVAEVPEFTLGKICATGFTDDDGFIVAAAGPRGRQAYAMGR